MSEPKHTYALVSEKGWVYAVFNDEDRANEQAEKRSVPLDQVNPDKGLHCYSVVRYIPDESAKAEAQPAGTGWVDCADRMPPTGCSVIVDGGAGYFDGIEWRTLMGTAEHRPITWTVTHWMPWPKLPPPPERDR